MPGAKRRSSSGAIRLAARDALPSEDRSTLVPCPVCDGAKMVPKLVKGTTRYRAAKCRWCDGHGCVDAEQMMAWVRWQRMSNRAKAAGRVCMLR